MITGIFGVLCLVPLRKIKTVDSIRRIGGIFVLGSAK